MALSQANYIYPTWTLTSAAGIGKLCGAFLVDQAFENYMIMKSGLKFDKVQANEFRLFVNDEWESVLTSPHKVVYEEHTHPFYEDTP